MKRKTILFAIAALFAVSIGCLTGSALGVGAQQDSSSVIPDKAFVGDVIAIPDSVTVDGKEYNAVVKVIAPDNSVYTGSEIALNLAGKYTFKYEADGKTIRTDSCMCIRRPQDFFEVNNFAECSGVTDYKYATGYKGLNFSVAKGATIDFSREIDLFSYTKDELLMELLVMPSEKTQADFSGYSITFTDVTDENNTLTFHMTDSTMDNCNGQASYVRVGGNDQNAGGWAYSGSKFIFDTRSLYGTPLYSGFRGVENGECLSLKFYYDNAEHAVYGYRGFDYRMSGKTLIADLDDPSVFGANIWEGFKSGKVRAQITFDGFVNERGNLMILKFGGFDLSSAGYEDSTAPIIDIDLNGEIKAPDSVIGFTYKIFEASARDNFDESVSVGKRVVFTNPADGHTVDVATDGKTLVTDRIGIYTIIYDACDLSGNECEEHLSFFCTGRANVISVTSEESDKTATLYDVVSVSGTDSVTAFGGYGNLVVERIVTAPNGDNVVCDGNSFVPNKVGTYILEYKARDFFNNEGKQSFVITVNALKKPVFINDVILPQVLVAGFTYNIPTIAAKECVNDIVKDVNVETYVNGQKCDGEFIAPSAAEAKITYKATGASGNAEDRIYTVPVVDGKNGTNQAAYFYGAGVTVTESQTSIGILANSDAGVLFANTLNPDAFTIGMTLIKEKMNYESFRIILSDADEPKIRLTFAFRVKDDKIYVSTSDGTTSSMAAKANDFSLKYNNSDLLIRDINNVNVGLVRYDDDGNSFKGFDGAVYMKIVFDGVDGDSALDITELNNQKLGYRTENADNAKDDTKPEIVIGGEYVYKQTQHKSIRIYNAFAYDVLSEVRSLTVKVTAPSGKTIIDDMPADSEYSVELSELGIYRIVYTAYDKNGNRALAGSTINAEDSVAPVLNVDTSSIKSVYRVGSTVTLPEVTVTDDTAQVYYDIYLQTPDNDLRLLIHGEGGTEKSFISSYGGSFASGERAFCLDKSGKYVLRFASYDGNYNFVVKTVEITVV